MIKYDNCKNCVRLCEHRGKDREFVCPNGISCKATYDPARQEKAARDFVQAIRVIASKPGNLDNLEHYLSTHFAEWLKKYAFTPDEIVAEMQNFAEMEI